MRSILLALCALIILFTIASAQTLQVVGSIDKEKPRIVAKAKVNGEAVLLLIATNDVLSLSLFPGAAERLGVEEDPGRTAPAGKGLGRRVTKELSFEILGYDEFKIGATVFTDTRQHRKMEDALQLDGCIGWDFLRQPPLFLNWDKGVAESVLEVPEEARWWDKWEAQDEKDKRRLRFTLDFAGQGDVRVGVATGYTGHILVDGQLWDWAIEGFDGPRTLALVARPQRGKIEAQPLLWFDVLKIGRSFIKGVCVQRCPGLRKAEGADALLGLRFLSRLDMYVDGQDRSAYVRVRGRYAWPTDYNRLGAVFVPDALPGKVATAGISGKAQVLKGSPAWRAGLRDGDIYVRNGRIGERKQSNGNWPLLAYAPAGTKSKLVVLRDGKEIELVVTTEEIFPEAKKHDPLPRNPKPKPAEVK